MPSPKVFLSYRRQSSDDLARFIYDRLQSSGADVFFDHETLNGERFANKIEREIINCDYFLAILTPDTLDSEWVRREIETAIRHKKQIVPLVDRGFTLNNAPVPAELSDLISFDEIRYDRDYADAAVDRIRMALHLMTQDRSEKTSTLLSNSNLKGCAAIGIIIGLGLALVQFVLLLLQQSDPHAITPTSSLAVATSTADAATAITATPSELLPARIGISPFQGENCQTWPQELSVNSGIVKVDTLSEMLSFPLTAQARESWMQKGYSLLVGGDCTLSAKPVVQFEILETPVWYQVIEPTRMAVAVANLANAQNIIVALSEYIRHDFGSAVGSLRHVLPDKATFEGAASLRMLRANSSFFIGCYQDAVDQYSLLWDTQNDLDLLLNRAVASVNLYADTIALNARIPLDERNCANRTEFDADTVFQSALDDFALALEQTDKTRQSFIHAVRGMYYAYDAAFLEAEKDCSAAGESNRNPLAHLCEATLLQEQLTNSETADCDIVTRLQNALDLASAGPLDRSMQAQADFLRGFLAFNRVDLAEDPRCPRNKDAVRQLSSMGEESYRSFMNWIDQQRMMISVSENWYYIAQTRLGTQSSSESS